MGPGLLAPRRIDDGCSREAHREAGQDQTQERVGEEPRDGRSGMPDDRSEDAGRNHEYAEFGGFHQVFGPMLFQRLFHFYSPVRQSGSVTARVMECRKAFECGCERPCPGRPYWFATMRSGLTSAVAVTPKTLLKPPKSSGTFCGLEGSSSQRTQSNTNLYE